MLATESDLDLLSAAALAAGEIALSYHGGDIGTREKPGGQGPVTEADLAVDAMMRDRLMGARPDYGWLSEESGDDGARLERRATFILDPIDGTRAFIDGAKDWSHSIAVAEGGEITAAAVYLPMREALFTAERGRGAFLNGQPIRATETAALEGATVLSHKATLDPGHWRGGAPKVKRHFRSSLAYRLCLVAQGRFDAMLTLRPTWEWDVAAGSLIVSEAGGTVTDRSGAGPRFNRATPQCDGMIAAGDLHGPIMAALRSA